MGKHCTQELADCIQNCVDNYGDSWRATFCTLDCELVYAACVIRDFSRAIQGEDLAQASQVASKLDEIAVAYHEAACSIRTKTAIGFTNLEVKKQNGEYEPFYPDAKLLPSLVASGTNIVIARSVTDKVIQQFRDGDSTADIRGYALAELESLDQNAGANYRTPPKDSKSESCTC